MDNLKQNNDGRKDFDFLLGNWTIYNRRLKENLVNCDDWEEFEGNFSCQRILGDLGSIDTCIMTRDNKPMHCLTLRLFSPETQEWSLYWSDSRHGTLTIPMIGRFKDSVGYFYAHELIQKQHILSRFIWSDITETSCHWEQAFSTDGGQTWETNWTMDFVRQ